jgi:uncharacterized alpha-E superfamily protein
MLSRTAENLFWLARYMERAEDMARIVQAGHWMASMARSLGHEGSEWQSTLLTSGCEAGFLAKHAEITADSVVDYLVRDPLNPSSIVSCFKTARHNARTLRTALTTDMWSSTNETWMQIDSKLSPDLPPEQIAESLEWVKERSLLFNGSYSNTMLRNDAYYFSRLGTFLERADNTARILDVKYHVLLPEDEGVGGPLDYYQWQAILRTVSALRGYHWVYQERLKPWLVAELLILRPEMPRSLLNCCDQISQHLELLADGYGGKRGACHRRAAEIHAQLRQTCIQEIVQSGLHEFLADFVDRMIELGDEIRLLYLT